MPRRNCADFFNDPYSPGAYNIRVEVPDSDNYQTGVVLSSSYKFVSSIKPQPIERSHLKIPDIEKTAVEVNRLKAKNIGNGGKVRNASNLIVTPSADWPVMSEEKGNPFQ